MTIPRSIISLASVACLLASGLLTAQESTRFIIVVNSSNATSSMTSKEISKIFLKKSVKWKNGQKIMPVDQVEGSSVRQAFSNEIHGMEVSWVKSYWQRMFFSGRSTAPPELTSDKEVLSYVVANAAAIGYVSRSAKIGEGVKVVEVTD